MKKHRLSAGLADFVDSVVLAAAEAGVKLPHLTQKLG
jgi:hypothetical protein